MTQSRSSLPVPGRPSPAVGPVYDPRYPVPAVKICGLTNLEDAFAAAAAGADFLGFVFAPSPRRLNPDRARQFWLDLPREIPKVGVFKGQTLEEIERLLDLLPLDYLQFHGSEKPAFCRVFDLPVIRAIQVRTVADLRLAEGYLDVAELLLVDLPKEDAGQGVLPVEIARRAVALPKPVLLAGGLTPENVGALVEEVRPFGVDVARGVESSPGKKDHEAMRRFILAAKGAGVREQGGVAIP